MTPTWHHLIEPDPRTGPDNMAIDDSLLRAAREGGAFLRLYCWSPACLSFGRNEPARSRYDRERIHQLGLETVRRPTGGRAVWHDREVTYAVAGPEHLFGSLRETYIRIHAMIAGGLRRLGAPAKLADRPRGPAARLGDGACFASAVGGEIMVGDRKLVGSAQFRARGAFLQHGSVLLANGQDLVAQVSQASRRPPSATSLDAVLDRPVSFSEVARAIVAEAQCVWPGAWHTGSDRHVVKGRTRFHDSAWTWRR